MTAAVNPAVTHETARLSTSDVGNFFSAVHGIVKRE
jgi:hypothetical protein